MVRYSTLACLLMGVVACTADTKGSDARSPIDPGTNETGGANSGGSDDDDPSPPASSNGDGPSEVPGATGGGDDASVPGCTEVVVDSQPTIPDMLIVLDKSASMIFVGCDALSFAEKVSAGCVNVLGLPQTPPPPFDKPFDRWTPSVAAINGLTARLQNKIAFGLMLFPGVQDACSSGSFSVQPAIGTANAIARTLAGAEPDGSSTPTPGTLRAARAIFETPPEPGQRPAAGKYVLLVTDGAPNCTASGASDTSNATPSPSELESFAAVEALTQTNVKTYVIGFDTASTPEFASVLDEMARRGGTGDTAHRPVEDEQSLIAELETITSEATSCTYTLDRADIDPVYVRVTLDGKDIAFGDGGWGLADPSTIELRGEACSTLQNGRDHSLSIKVECDPVVVM